MKAIEHMFARARPAFAMAVGLGFCVWTLTRPPRILAMATSTSSNGGCVVAKTVFSTKIRLLLVLGVEGTGHHYIIGANEDIFEAHADLPVIEKGFPSKDPYYIPYNMKISADGFDNARKNARRDMRDLARRAGRISSPGTFQLLDAHSIPTGHGPQKVMQYVDPRLIAEAAEAEGVDLRVLYMKRPARELLLANTAHRDFEDHLGSPANTPKEKKFMEYVRVLFTDVAVVHSFLAELDPSFVVCHDWSLFGDPDQAHNIADAIAPNADVASIVREALVDSASNGPRHRGKAAHPFDKDDVLSSRIQQKFDSFEHLYCSRETR